MKKSNKVLVVVLVAFLLIAGSAVWRFGGVGNFLPAGKSLTASVYSTFVESNNFAILAGSTITNTGSSVINGDLGLSPGTAITGFFGTTENDGPGTINGSIHQTDATAGSAQTSLTAAYTAAANQSPPIAITADLGTMSPLTPGVYNSGSSIGLTGTLTLDAEGDENAVWIFQAGSTLTTASGSGVVFKDGIGSSCNVFWVVGSSAILGSSSNFKGNIFALESISIDSGSTVDGRLLARNAAVTLINTVVTAPTCTAYVPPPPPASATLHVIKSVINVGVGTATSSDFTLHVKNSGGIDVDVLGSPGAPLSGVALPGRTYTLSPGTYAVTEDDIDPLLYSQNFFGADCVPGGSVTLSDGDEKFCTIINTDVAPPVPVVVSSNGSGGGSSYVPVVPLIGILKVPTPLALPRGPDKVTFDYTVWNVSGKQALVGVTVKDDKCGPVTLLSGDSNSNGKLDITEKWKYSCTTTLSNTTINTAVATGYSDDSYHQAAIATAIATVVVGAPVPPPLIAIVKVPSRLTPFPFGGGNVTYTYTVTNPGVVALHDVSVTDDKCAPISVPTGDTNGDNLLDPTETWTYTCQTNVSISTRNVATALGKANGLTAINYAFATVLVSFPGPPNTGLPPE